MSAPSSVLPTIVFFCVAAGHFCIIIYIVATRILFFLADYVDLELRVNFLSMYIISIETSKLSQVLSVVFRRTASYSETLVS